MSKGYQIDQNDSFYFVTFTVVGWVDVFTRDVYRHILADSLKHCQKHKSLEIGAWVFMTNHLHLIIASKNPETFPLSAIIRDFKSFTSRQMRKELEANTSESRRPWMLPLFYKTGLQNTNNRDFQFWQQHNHSIELNNNKKLKQRLNYLHENPVKAGFVSRPEDWAWSSASAYCGETSVLELVFLD